MFSETTITTTFGRHTPLLGLSIAAAARLDRQSRYGTFLSPRLSALYRLGGQWSVRVSRGSGSFAPTPLTPENTGGVDLAWEEDDPYRTWTPGYTTVEILAAKQLGRVQIFGNVDDLTNVRQTRWDPLLRPTPGPGGRWTTEEWAPVEGRVLNLGVRISF